MLRTDSTNPLQRSLPKLRVKGLSGAKKGLAIAKRLSFLLESGPQDAGAQQGSRKGSTGCCYKPPEGDLEMVGWCMYGLHRPLKGQIRVDAANYCLLVCHSHFEGLPR